MNDLKFAFRQLLQNPGFTTVAVLTIALGIGANLALFAIFNELLLRPKPVANPDELWAIEPATSAGEPIPNNTCRPYYDAIRRDARVFNGTIGYARITPKLRTKEGAERIVAELVSGDYFTFLGVAPVLGRGFLPEEDAKMGTHSVAVLSYSFWHDQFGGAQDVIGKTLTINDNVVEIVGVAPKEFSGVEYWQPNLWMPASMEKILDAFTVYHIVGRLTDRKLALAAAELLTPIAAEVTEELSGFKDPQWSRYGYSPAFQSVRLDPIGRGSLGIALNRDRVLAFLRLAGAATVLLLLIACANVANLLLARGIQRQKELATRLALGATRTALLRQLVIEGVLLAVLGALGATLAFSWVGNGIVKFGGWWHGPAVDPVPDWRVLLFAAGSALAVGVGFSLFPALQSTGIEPFAALKDAECGRGSVGRRAWLGHGLVVAQIAGSLVLLCGATLCLRSMGKQLSVDLGFRPDLLAVVPLNLERIGYTPNTVTLGLDEIVRRVALIPGVEQVGISRQEPFDSLYGETAISNLEGYKSPDGDIPHVSFGDVGPGVFAALGIPVLHGREINRTDVEQGRKVIVVNESFVRKFWPDAEPLGKHIDQDEVIGVVKDARFNRFDAPPEAMMLRRTSKESLLYPKLLIRAKRDPRQAIGSLRSELSRIHPRLVDGEISTLRNMMKNALAMQLGALRVLSVLGGLALALAVIGTYGVMAYLVSRRTREIGVRIALGATRGSVVKLILTGGLRLGFIALAIGLPLALGAAGLLRHQLAGISPFDPLSFVAVTLCVLMALISACLLPARRAARVDPMEALRYE